MAADLTAIRAALDKHDATPTYHRGNLDLSGVLALASQAPAIRAALDELEAVRAKLAEAKRLGLEACEMAASYADDAREYVGEPSPRIDEIRTALEAL